MRKQKAKKPTEGLTDTQHRVLVGFEAAWNLSEYPHPSVREVAILAGYNSPGTTYRHLKELARKGYIKMTKAVHHRGMELLHSAPRNRRNGNGASR